MTTSLLIMAAGIVGYLFCLWMIRRQRGERCAVWIGLSSVCGGFIGYHAASLLMAVAP